LNLTIADIIKKFPWINFFSAPMIGREDSFLGFGPLSAVLHLRVVATVPLTAAKIHLVVS
jgi:hypothetical protein